jgi:hypothetical protein
MKYSISIKKFSPYDNLFNTGRWKNLLFEIGIHLIAPYHYLEGIKYVEMVEAWDYEVSYEVNDILLWFSFIRIYSLINFSLYSTNFMNPRSQRVCTLHGCDANYMFAVKCLTKNRPYTCLISSLFVTTVIFGYHLRIFEGPLSDISGQLYTDLPSCMWNVIVTLSSTGYGELYPKSYFGRVVGIIICFWGVFIVSAIVVTVTDLLEFNPREARAFNLSVNLL